jgi:hypothetical protein
MGKFKVGDRVMVDGGLYEGKATVTEVEYGGGYLLETDGTHKGMLPCGRLWQPELHLTLVKEFSVGDIVRGTHGNPYGVTNEDMTKGEVTYIGASGSIGVKVIEHKHRGWESSAFSALDPKHFELVTQAPKFKAGDKVKSKNYGSVYTLTERDYRSDGDRYGVAWKIEEGSWIGENQIEAIVELPEAPVEEPKVGDRIKVTGGGVMFEGETGVVDAVRPSGFGDADKGLTYVKDDGMRRWAYIHNVEVIEPVREEETKTNEIKKGDFVKVVKQGIHFLKVGSIAKVTGVFGGGSLDVEGVSKNGGNFTNQSDSVSSFEKVDDVVQMVNDGLDVTAGRYYEVVERTEGIVSIIDDAGDYHTFDLDGDYVKEVGGETKFVRMLEDDPADDFEKGDILELIDADTFIDRVGDERELKAFDYEFVTEVEKPTTKNDVVDYLRKISADEVLEIIAEVRN